MSILKKLKKQPKPADLATISRTLANVKKLIDLKVITVNLQDPEFSLYPELWYGKDQKFKTNFCKNIRIWRSVTIGRTERISFETRSGESSFDPEQIPALIFLHVKDIESGDLIGIFNGKSGYKPV